MQGVVHTPDIDWVSPQASTKLLGIVPVVLVKALGLVEGALSNRLRLQEMVVLLGLGLLYGLGALVDLVYLDRHPSGALVLNGQGSKDGA
jgi:hypothetical protein